MTDPPTRSNTDESDRRFREKYPALWHFLYDYLWQGADGPYVLDLLIRIFWFAHPERARALERELRAVATDDDFTSAFLSNLFNREDYDGSTVIVTAATVRAFCASTAEALAFLMTKRPTD